MRDIAMRFPKFGNMSRILAGLGKAMPPRMQESISGAYETLLFLLQEMLKIFYKVPESMSVSLIWLHVYV
jgi:hypothetical protein